MKTTRIIVWLFILVCPYISFGQSNKKDFKIAAECGTPPMPDSIASKQKWYGNNNYLLEVLKNYGYDLPKDYFDEIDTRGFYKGERLNIADYKRDNKNNSEPSKPDKSGRTGIEGNNPQENLTINGTTVKYIKVKSFSYLNAAGQGYTAAQINASIEAANEFYRLNNVPIIFFSLCNDITFVPNSIYFNVASGTDAYIMFGTHNEVDVMKLHFVNTANINGSLVSGLAASIGGNSLLVTNSAGSATLAHELGHCLGLQHTHNPKLPCIADGNEDCADCWQESVSRTRTQPFWCASNVGQKKCAVYGDGLCDTPGEPNLTGHIALNCTIDWSSGVDNTDNWNTQWTPMDFNIMSYARASLVVDCRDLFSPGQIAIMLATVPYFATTADPYSITGPTTVCNNYSYSYSIPSLTGVTNYTWAVPTGASIISGQGTNGITVSFTNAGSNQTVRVTPNCGFPRTHLTVSALNYLTIWGDTYPSINQYVSYSTNHLPGAYYYWSTPSGWVSNGGEGTDYVSLVTQGYPGPAYLSVSTDVGSCTLYGSMFINVQDGGIQYLKANVDFLGKNEPKGISIYDNNTGKFVPVKGDYTDAWEQMGQGLNIIRITYQEYSETIKVVKQ